MDAIVSGSSDSPAVSIDTGNDLRRLAARARVYALGALGVPVAVFAALAAWLGTPQVLPAALGAVGWMIALGLRQPVALVAFRVTTKDRATTVVGWASGPAEEVVRLLLVVFVLRTGSAAAWAGAGWMAVEVVIMCTVNGLVIGRAHLGHRSPGVTSGAGRAPNVGLSSSTV